MKLKKLKSSDVSAGIAQVVGAGAGFMATNGIANAIAKVDDEALITEEQKKTKLFVSIGAVLLGGYLALSVDGNDVAAVAAKSFGTGLAGGGVKGIVQHVAKDTVATLPAGTPTSRLIAGALNCPCEEAPKVAYPTYSRALAMPVVNYPQFSQAREVAQPTYSVE